MRTTNNVVLITGGSSGIGLALAKKFLSENNSLDLIEIELKTNLMGPILLIKLFLPQLLTKETAAIINVSSGLGLVPKQSAPVYCGTKAGLHIFTKSLRWQLESTNIKVFEIIPSLVDTAMTKGRGSGKISPEKLIDEFWKNFKRDNHEIRIERVKLLYIINSLLP